MLELHTKKYRVKYIYSDFGISLAELIFRYIVFRTEF